MQSLLDTSANAPRAHEGRTVIDLPLEVKAGGLPGEFEGYGAVFGNTDRDGDVVAKGAFADSLKERLPALLWQHNAKEPIGRFDVVREDERGLFVKGRLAQSGRGAEAYELLKMGALNGLSIGFVTKEAIRGSAEGTRTIKRAELMEVSLVTFPANELARVQTVKQRMACMDRDYDAGDINDPRTFERFLREQGFSRNRAKAITAKGFKVQQAEGVDQLVAAVRDKSERLQGLSQKRLNIPSIIRSILGGGSRATIVAEVVRNIAGAYRSVRGTSMPIHVLPGRSKKFKLSLGTGLRSSVEVSVEQPPGSSHEFECEIDYWAWEERGPKVRVLTLTDRRLTGSLTIGSRSDIEKWLNREYEQLLKNDKIDEFDRILSRVNDVISQGLAPVGVFKYKRLVSAPRVFINDGQRGITKEEAAFRITAA